MMPTLRRYWPAGLLLGILLVMIGLTLEPYRGNPSALFHIDHTLASQHAMPTGTVVLNVLGYDGMEYWQIARNISTLVNPSLWPTLRDISPGSYAYQRILLPVIAFVVALGQESLLPWSFLLINILSLIGICVLLLRANIHPLYALALSLCPAAMVGLHFSLAEPLSLFLITLFLLRYVKTERLDAINLLTLCLIVLSREINILFIMALMGFSLWKGRYRQIVLLLIPAAVFLLWHSIIFQIFQEIPFLWSTQKSTFPLSAIVELLMGKKGYNIYTGSSIVLFLLFVLPATIWAIAHLIKARSFALLPSLLLFFLAIMLAMPDHIWGSITSIGRVITPVYPLYILSLAQRNTSVDRLLALALLAVGFGAAIGLALIHHPFVQL